MSNLHVLVIRNKITTDSKLAAAYFLIVMMLSKTLLLLLTNAFTMRKISQKGVVPDYDTGKR